MPSQKKAFKVVFQNCVYLGDAVNFRFLHLVSFLCFVFCRKTSNNLPAFNDIFKISVVKSFA